jgi:phosphoribosylformylglycinamidine synthase
MCIAGRLGADLTRLPHDRPATALFAESQGRFVVEIAPHDLDEFERLLTAEAETGTGSPMVIGTVTDIAALRIDGIAPIHLDELVAAHQRTGRPR